MKKTIALALALLTAILAVAACGPKTPSGPAQTSEAPGDTEDDAYRTSVPAGFDADGYSFVILNSGVHEIAGLLNDMVVTDYEETSNDYVSEAIYRRNLAIEEKLKCSISEINEPSGELVRRIDDSYQSGTDDYSLCNIIGNNIYGAANNGLLYNLNVLPYVDLTREWWTQGAVEAYSLNHLLFYCSSDLTICDDEATCIVMYNRTVAENYRLESPEQMYELVVKGGWTWEKFFASAKKVSTGGDNGDGVLSDGDMFGCIVCDWSYIAMMIAADCRFSEKEEGADDRLRIAFADKKFIDRLDRLVDLTKSKRAFLATLYDGKFSRDHFGQNEALMIMQVVAHIRNARATEDDFGVLPMPKYDDQQDNYYSYTNRVPYLGVPCTIQQPEKVGAILEELTALSSKIVIPNYLDKSIGDKFMRDPGSKRMIPYIFGHTVYDPLVTTVCWDTVFGSFTSMLKSRANMVVNVEKKYGNYIRGILEDSWECYTRIAEEYI